MLNVELKKFETLCIQINESVKKRSLNVYKFNSLGFKKK